MKRIFYLITLFTFHLIFVSCTNPIEDKFNLNFNYSNSSDFIWKNPQLTPPIIDSIEFINSKAPLYFEAKQKFPLNRDLKVELFQTFILPPQLQKSKEIKISIHNKCINMDDMKLIISGINKEGEIIKTSYLSINTYGEWKCTFLKVHFDDLAYFTVTLFGDGRFKDETPRLYLDRMTIQIDGKDINQIKGINNLSGRKKEILAPEVVHQLSSYDKSILKEIGLSEKKIIALGETVHGSKTINETGFRMIKNMILYNNCKLVLLEYDVASSLKHNLFVKGNLPEDEIYNIREEQHSIHFDMDSFTEFLIWLRKYNETQERKVNFLGLLDKTEFLKTPLFDYIFAFYDKKHDDLFYPLLDHIHQSKFKEAFYLTLNYSEKLISILGENEYFLFKHALLGINAIENPEILINLDNNDYHMWLNANAFISQYVKEKEMTCIYAHYGHVQKKEGMEKAPAIPTTGGYLNNYYKNEYGVIGITVGTGKITTRETYSFDFTTAVLDNPEKESFEEICMRRDIDCFYYPSKHLSQDIYPIWSIGNKENPYGKNQMYSLLKANTDGFIFLRTSEAFNDDYPYDTSHDWNQFKKRTNFLKSIQKKN